MAARAERGVRMFIKRSLRVPVVCQSDVCVIGGSCTGVFAAVRAARRGLRVAVVEQGVLFGGTATAALVNEWHSLYDTEGRQQIIGGLTAEVLERLRKRNAIIHTSNTPNTCYRFNSAELALELDELISAHEIRPFLQTRFVSAVREGDSITHAIIEDKTGCRAIQSTVFIDASGDGDLLRRAGFSAWKNPSFQPVSSQQLVAGLNHLPRTKRDAIWTKIQPLSDRFGYPRQNASPWFCDYPPSSDITNIFGARVNNIDASDADQLTQALIQGRRYHRALLDMIREELSPEVSTIAHAHMLGIRETWHAHCLHRLTGKEILDGKSFPDAVAYGTYPVDIHSPEGTVLRYLDGTEKIISKNGSTLLRRWKNAGTEFPRYYQIPFRSLVPQKARNLLICGRLLDADKEAFGSARVMVNTNQMGEAAGEAASLSIKTGNDVCTIEPLRLRKSLMSGGSLFPKKMHLSFKSISPFSESRS